MTRAYAVLGTAIGLLAATPAAAQTGIAPYAGEWVGSEITVEAGSWPELAAEGFAVAISGSDSEFEVDWVGMVPTDGTAAWDELSEEFERADRAGYYTPDDDPDVFDGEPQYWAFSGEAGLVLGRLQLDAAGGRHLLFVCQLVPTETGLDAVLMLSATETPTARARVSLVRQ